MSASTSDEYPGPNGRKPAKAKGTRSRQEPPASLPPLVVSSVEYTSPVGKAYEAKDGQIVRIPGWPMRTPTGRGRRLEFESFADFMGWRKPLGSSVILTSGTFECDNLEVVYKGRESEGSVSASSDYLSHRQQAGVMIIDTDVKTPEEVAARFPFLPEAWTPQRLHDTLLQIAPELRTVPLLVGWSTSGGITLKGKGRDKPAGVRAYIPVQDASQIPALLKVLHQRAIAAGLGWVFLNAAGFPLYRSIIDMMLATVTQPDFAAPHLRKGLVQDREWIEKAGTEYLGTLALSDEERAAYEMRMIILKEGIGPKVKPVREQFKRMLRDKHKVEDPEAALDAMLNGVIRGDMVIQFEKATVTVKELLDGRGAEFDGQNCLDPLEPDYRDGDDVGRFYWNEGLAPIVHTFAHGSHSLVLRYAPGDAMQAATLRDAVRVLALTYYETESEGHADRKATATKFKTKLAALDADIEKYITKARRVAPGFAPRARPEQDGPVDDGDSAGPGVLDEINEEYAVVDNSGDVSIWNPEPDANGKYSIYKVHDWYNLMLPKTVLTPQGVKPAGPIWMAWDKRRAFKGVGYWPTGEEPEGMLNLFHGLAVAPAAGPWPTLRAFLHDVICGGDEVSFEYMLKLFAWKLQNPTGAPEVALSMRSDEEGVGKGTLGRLWERWVGFAFTKASDSRYVFGEFNDCLIGAIVVFLDEALFAGDPRQVKKAMSAITEKTLVANPKGKPHIKLVNQILWIIATNNLQAIAAMITARRYFMLDITDTSMKEIGYRTAVHKAIDGVEAEHMAHALLAMDLGDWHPRDDVPQTEALTEQKRLSLHGPVAWWADVLEAREVGLSVRVGITSGLSEASWAAGDVVCSKVDLFEAYRGSDHARREQGKPMLLSTFCKVMGEITGGCAVRDSTVFRLPPYGECRDHFERRLAGKLPSQGTVSGQFMNGKRSAGKASARPKAAKKSV